MVNIKVKGADVDKYITLTLLLVDNTLSYECLSPDNHLVSNGPKVTLYLEREVMNEEYPHLIYLILNILCLVLFRRRNYLEESDTEILDGQVSFVLKNNKKMNYLCLELPT